MILNVNEPSASHSRPRELIIILAQIRYFVNSYDTFLWLWLLVKGGRSLREAGCFAPRISLRSMRTLSGRPLYYVAKE